MKTLLQINSSLHSDLGQSSRLAAGGGLYQGTPRDAQTAYVGNFLNFIGLHDLRFVYAEGLAMGEDLRQQALDGAAQAIDRFAA